MSNELPVDNRERNAFHEAGHVIAAWRVTPKAVGTVEIGHYTSRSRICCTGFTAEQTTIVAVAGLLSEARGISGRRLGGNFGPLAGQILLHAERREPDGAQWVDVPLDEAITEKAAFSDDDFLLIHTDDHGSPERITDRLRASAEIVEQYFEDGRIEKLAKVLLNKGSLLGDQLRALLDNA